MKLFYNNKLEKTREQDQCGLYKQEVKTLFKELIAVYIHQSIQSR